MGIDKYRVESGSVYEYSDEHHAYIFIGKLNGQGFKSWIKDYENQSDDFYC